MSPARPNFGLDLVRASAIALVLFDHSHEWWTGTAQPQEVQAAFIGRVGVETFFSLSGFLIGTILLRLLAAGAGWRGLAGFWTRRWLRTLPAYWAVLLLLGCWFGKLDWRSMVFVQNFVPRRGWLPLTNHMWSLVLEEWFYLFVPVLLLGAWAALGRRRVRWPVAAACLGLIVVCTALRVPAGLQPSPVWGDDPSISPLLRLDCAAWGVMAAALAWRRTLPAPAAALLGLAGAAMLLLSGWVWAGQWAPDRPAPWGVQVWGWAYSPLHTSLEELGAACLVLCLHRLAPRAPQALARPVGTLARLSYAIYLVHVPVKYLARGFGLDDMAASDPAAWRARLLMAGLVLAAAVLLRMLVELPALALRDRLLPERSPAPVSAHAAA